VQLFVNPMATYANNVGESYVWFIALAIALFNIKLEAPPGFRIVQAVLALAPFFLAPYFIALLVISKMPYVPIIDKKVSIERLQEDTKSLDVDRSKDGDGDPEDEETAKTPKHVMAHAKTGLLIDTDGSKKITLPLLGEITLLKKAPPPEGALPPGGVYTDTVKMAETMRDEFTKKHVAFARIQLREKKKKVERPDTLQAMVSDLGSWLIEEEEKDKKEEDTIPKKEVDNERLKIDAGKQHKEQTTLDIVSELGEWLIEQENNANIEGNGTDTNGKEKDKDKKEENDDDNNEGNKKKEDTINRNDTLGDEDDAEDLMKELLNDENAFVYDEPVDEVVTVMRPNSISTEPNNNNTQEDDKNQEKDPILENTDEMFDDVVGEILNEVLDDNEKLFESSSD